MMPKDASRALVIRPGKFTRCPMGSQEVVLAETLRPDHRDNRLLAALSPETLAFLDRDLKHVSIAQGVVMFGRNPLRTGSSRVSNFATERVYCCLSSGSALANLWHSVVNSLACFVSMSNCFIAFVVQVWIKSDGPFASATSRAKPKAAWVFA
jgi:hypothetical protein